MFEHVLPVLHAACEVVGALSLLCGAASYFVPAGKAKTALEKLGFRLVAAAQALKKVDDGAAKLTVVK